MKGRDAPPRLGRGLAALFGDQAPQPAQADGPALPITAITPGRFQPRSEIDPASLRELTASIRQSGVLQPILVRPDQARPGHYEIIAGERRWRAAQAAGLQDIPALVRPLSDTEAMAASLVENLQRQDLNPIEEADGYARLMGEFALTQDQLGDVVGKSRSHVANTLRLLQLPKALRGHVTSKALTAGHARALLTHPDQEAAAAAVIARGLSVRQTEALTQRSLRPSPAPPGPARDQDAATVERGIATRLGLAAKLVRSGQGGRLQIEYKTPDELDRLVQLLLG